MSVTQHPVESLPLASLKPHPRNYREHPDDQLAHIEQSLREHGQYRNIVVAEDGTILAGHGVVEAAQRLGLTALDGIRLPIKPDDPRALRVLAGDNEMGRRAMIDDRALSEILRDVYEQDVDGLLGTGYDEQMLANLLYVTRPASEIADFDAAAAWAGMPSFDPGDLDYKVVVICASKEERDRFVEASGVGVMRGNPDNRVWSARFPAQARDDLNAVRYQQAG